jgi:coniferyl-aldehyde dehydrogenase
VTGRPATKRRSNAIVSAPQSTRDLETAFARLRHAQDADGGLPLPRRRAALGALRNGIKASAEDFARSIDADFGARSRHETLIAEIGVVLAAIDYAMSRLKRWARPERVHPGWRFWPASSRIIKEPRGVVGIIAPWNYPVQLALLPLVAALGAGCRAIVKPSELAPETADLLVRLLANTFAPDMVAPVLGDAEIAAALTRLPLDALLFTGSAAVGRKVMRAAAESLTPVTLELGGKCPAIIDASADLQAAAEAIIAGKLLNAGQTCVAPDYVLVPHAARDAFVDAAKAAARRLYPDPAGGDYGAIRGAAARDRLLRLQDGLDAVPLFAEMLASPRLTPALVLDPPAEHPILHEEIFGPLLPVLSYAHPDQALAMVNARPAPPALYWFGKDRAALAHVLARTASGTVAVNDTVVQAAVEALPFGGLGASGFGAYHGRAGFDAFTHRRAVFVQSRWGLTRLMRPPYGARAERLLRILLR